VAAAGRLTHGEERALRAVLFRVTTSNDEFYFTNFDTALGGGSLALASGVVASYGNDAGAPSVFLHPTRLTFAALNISPKPSPSQVEGEKTPHTSAFLADFHRPVLQNSVAPKRRVRRETGCGAAPAVLMCKEIKNAHESYRFSEASACPQWLYTA